MRGLGGAQIGLATVTCKDFLAGETLQYAGWPQGEGKGRTINLRSIDRSPFKQEICMKLDEQAVAGSSAPDGMAIPPCVREALKEVLAVH